MDSLKRKIKELERRIDQLEVKFELMEKYVELSDLDSLLLQLDLSSQEINEAVSVINRYSKTEVLKNWDSLGITKYTIKKELEKVSRVFVSTENVEEFVSALANEIGDENYLQLAERLSWKVMESHYFNGIQDIE